MFVTHAPSNLHAECVLFVVALAASCAVDERPLSGPGDGGVASGGSAGTMTSTITGTANAGSGGAAGTGAAAADASPDANSSAEAGDAATPIAHLRVAHLVPDAPAADICFRPHDMPSAPFSIGPMLKAKGGSAGLAYGQVSSYFELPAGTYDVRTVAPNAADCASSIGLADALNLPSLVGGSYTTYAAMGLVQGSATTKIYSDERSVSSGKTKLRFIYASPGGAPVDVGTGMGESFIPLLTNVAFGSFGAGPTALDANGYAELPPLSGATFASRPTGTTMDRLIVTGVTAPSGAVLSSFEIGVFGSTTTPLKLLACADLETPQGAYSSCTVLP